MADTTNALTRLSESARQMITTPQALADRIREWREIAHVLTPAVQISAIAAQHAVSVAVVVLDPTFDRATGMGAEIYSVPDQKRGVPWLSTGEAAIGKVGLLKLAQAAGISWDPRASGRTDDRKERYYWEYKAVGSYVGFDGREQVIIGTFELDYRDGSPHLKGFQPNQIDSARKAGLRICEAKAMNAAVRTIGLRQKYTLAELQKPFVVFRTTFQPDMRDPEQRRMVAARALGGASALYPQSRQIEAGSAHPDIDVEPARDPDAQETTAAGATVNTVTGEIVAEKTTAPAQPAEPTGPTIVRIDPQHGKTRDSGRDFTKHVLTLSDGKTIYTFSADVAKLAGQFLKDKTPIEVSTQESRWGFEILELTRASARLPYDNDGPSDSDLKL